MVATVTDPDGNNISVEKGDYTEIGWQILGKRLLDRTTEYSNKRDDRNASVVNASRRVFWIGILNALIQSLNYLAVILFAVPMWLVAVTLVVPMVMWIVFMAGKSEDKDRLKKTKEKVAIAWQNFETWQLADSLLPNEYTPKGGATRSELVAVVGELERGTALQADEIIRLRGVINKKELPYRSKSVRDLEDMVKIVDGMGRKVHYFPKGEEWDNIL